MDLLASYRPLAVGDTVRMTRPSEGHLARGIRVGTEGTVHAGPERCSGLYIVWFGGAGQFFCDRSQLEPVSQIRPAPTYAVEWTVPVPRKTLQQAHDFIRDAIHWSGGDRTLLNKLDQLLRGDSHG